MFQSPVQGGDLLTGLGDLALEHAETLSLAGLTGGRLGEPDAGQVGFGTRLVERAAQLLQPALEQHGPVRAGGGGRTRREAGSTRGRYAVSQGKRTMCHTIAKRVSSRNP